MNEARDPEGRFASHTFEAVYDALKREINRIAELRSADQLAVTAALTSAEKATFTALTAAKEAVNKAEENQRRVNEGQNEFRAQLKDQASMLIPRHEAELLHRALRERVDALKQSVDIGAGHQEGASATWGTVVAVSGVSAVIGGTIIGLIFNLAK